MPIEIITTNRFLKEVALAKKRGKDLSKLKEILRRLAADESLDGRYKNHKLAGKFKNRWECHLEPDWLFVYLKTETQIICERIGTHSDLFE